MGSSCRVPIECSLVCHRLTERAECAATVAGCCSSSMRRRLASDPKESAKYEDEDGRPKRMVVRGTKEPPKVVPIRA